MATTMNDTTPSPPSRLQDMPTELLIQIITKLSHVPQTWLRLRSVCRTLRRATELAFTTTHLPHTAVHIWVGPMVGDGIPEPPQMRFQHLSPDGLRATYVCTSQQAEKDLEEVASRRELARDVFPKSNLSSWDFLAEAGGDRSEIERDSSIISYAPALTLEILGPFHQTLAFDLPVLPGLEVELSSHTISFLWKTAFTTVFHSVDALWRGPLSRAWKSCANDERNTRLALSEWRSLGTTSFFDRQHHAAAAAAAGLRQGSNAAAKDFYFKFLDLLSDRCWRARMSTIVAFYRRKVGVEVSIDDAGTMMWHEDRGRGKYRLLNRRDASLYGLVDNYGLYTDLLYYEVKKPPVDPKYYSFGPGFVFWAFEHYEDVFVEEESVLPSPSVPLTGLESQFENPWLNDEE